MKTLRPSELELQILSILWEKGPRTVRDIRESLPDGKERAYTTVLTLVQIMEKKGFLGHTAQGQAHLYHPLVKQSQVLRPMMREMLKNIFRGNAAHALQCLLDGTKVDDDELAEIQNVLKNATVKKSHKEKGRR